MASCPNLFRIRAAPSIFYLFDFQSISKQSFKRVGLSALYGLNMDLAKSQGVARFCRPARDTNGALGRHSKLVKYDSVMSCRF